MAKIMTSGLDLTTDQLERLGRAGIRRIVEAGAAAAQMKMQALTREAGHVRNGDLIGSIQPGTYYESLNAGAQVVEFRGTAANGLSYRDMAWFIDNGRGGRRGPRSGDHFLTAHDREAEEAAQEAMAAEADRILAEIDG